MKHFALLVICLFQISVYAQTKELKVVQFDIREDIAPSATRMVQKGFGKAREVDADFVIIHMDTYGGLLTDADSIRKTILNAPMPVIVFIDKNAASAGALISLACDRIYMSPGATIGSATVVNEGGEVLPDKYQSYMRSIMRATAESHGRDTLIKNGDTLIRFKRNPAIAEAMVDERIAIPDVVDSGRIAAFTSAEAIKIRFCDGEANSISEVLQKEGISHYELIEVKKTGIDKLIGFLSAPAIQGILIMFIFWGIFFELRTPGIGFPLLAASISALLYFAPLYLDGLAQNWEILLFVIGLILIILEIFVIPGFGVTGITGIVLTITSLILSLVRNVNFDFSETNATDLNKALLIVIFSLVGFVVGLILFGKGFMNSPLSKRLVLSDTLENARVGKPASGGDSLVGQTGIARTAIRPMGKIMIGDVMYDVKSQGEFIEEGSGVRVISREFSYWIVVRNNA
ncbi:MAG: nodulation protein NfeD [Bacteroidetes bacterium]|nr:nodulation protein NfeD [Bacteroidota bacterium]